MPRNFSAYTVSWKIDSSVTSKSETMSTRGESVKTD